MEDRIGDDDGKRKTFYFSPIDAMVVSFDFVNAKKRRGPWQSSDETEERLLAAASLQEAHESEPSESETEEEKARTRARDEKEKRERKVF